MGERRNLGNDNGATYEVRTETAGAAASAIAAIPEVRAALKDRQRAFRRPPGLVTDGRDMGPVCFPDARFKVFMTASAEESAERGDTPLKDTVRADERRVGKESVRRCRYRWWASHNKK